MSRGYERAWPHDEKGSGYSLLAEEALSTNRSMVFRHPLLFSGSMDDHNSGIRTPGLNKWPQLGKYNLSDNIDEGIEHGFVLYSSMNPAIGTTSTRYAVRITLSGRSPLPKAYDNVSNHEADHQARDDLQHKQIAYRRNSSFLVE